MCLLSSCATDQNDSKSASPDASPHRRLEWSAQYADDELASVLLAFFRKRLRAAPGSVSRPDQARLLVRRTLDRLARQRADSDAPSGSVPQKEDVMRAALMELQHRGVPEQPRPDDRAPIIRRN